MTIRDFSEQPPLHTDHDVLTRVIELVGPAITERQLWIMWVDGDDMQAPAIMPVPDLPLEPDRRMLEGLSEVLGGLREELTTERGHGSVFLTVERIGPDEVLPSDLVWVEALAAACRAGGVELRGIYLCTPRRVERLMGRQSA